MPLHRFDDSPLPRPEAGSRPSSEDTEPGGRGEATAEPTALPAPTVAESRSVALTPPEGVAPAGRHERGRGRWCCAQAIVPADRERAWQGAAGATGGRRHASGSKMRTNSPEVTRTRRPPWVARQLRTIKIADFPCVPRGWRPISSWCPPRALMERVRTSHPCRRSEDRLPTTRTPCSYPCSYPHLCPKTPVSQRSRQVPLAPSSYWSWQMPIDRLRGAGPQVTGVAAWIGLRSLMSPVIGREFDLVEAGCHREFGNANPVHDYPASGRCARHSARTCLVDAIV